MKLKYLQLVIKVKIKVKIYKINKLYQLMKVLILIKGMML